MRLALGGIRGAMVVVALVGFLVVGGCGGACPGGCMTSAEAVFELTCGQNDLVSVVTSAPCSVPPGWNPGYQSIVPVGASSPGTCHVELVFASGFTYSADVTFTMHSDTPPPGCGKCPDYLAPTAGPFIVDNPSDTCIDGGLDAGADAALDAASTE